MTIAEIQAEWARIVDLEHAHVNAHGYHAALAHFIVGCQVRFTNNTDAEGFRLVDIVTTERHIDGLRWNAALEVLLTQASDAPAAWYVPGDPGRTVAAWSQLEYGRLTTITETQSPSETPSPEFELVSPTPDTFTWECAACGEISRRGERNCECWHCDACDTEHTEDTTRCDACSNCTDEHDCVWCNSHDRWHSDGRDMCSHCDSCLDRCNCTICRNCGTRCNDSYCNDCEQCESCCDCNYGGDYPIPRRSYGLAFRPASTFIKNPLTRFLSVEIETQGAQSDPYSLIATLRRWETSSVDDGSLNEYGFELNTQPANGDEFYTLVSQTADALGDAECLIDDNCGLHVHVDARDISEKELRKVIALYQITEPMLYALSGNRAENSYCKPSGKFYGYWIHDAFQARTRLRSRMYGAGAKLTKRDLERDRKNGKFATRLAGMNHHYNSVRYHALNLHTFYDRQTIEFRHHKGTIDATRIRNWALVCGSLVEYAKTHTYEEIMALPGTNGGLEALKTITDVSLHEWIQGRFKWLKTSYWEENAFDYPSARAIAIAEDKAQREYEAERKRERERAQQEYEAERERQRERMRRGFAELAAYQTFEEYIINRQGA